MFGTKEKKPLPSPFKLEDVLYKFEYYGDDIGNLFTKTEETVYPLKIGYTLYSLRSFFNKITAQTYNYDREVKNGSKMSYDTHIKNSSEVTKIINAIPINLINEVYNIFTHELFDKRREDALHIDMENLSPEDKEFINFLMTVDYNKFPGTPLHKAVMVSFVITKNSIASGKGEEGEGQGQGAGGEDGENGEEEGEDEGKSKSPLEDLGLSHSNVQQMAEDVELLEKIKPNSFTDKTLSINQDVPGSYLNSLLDRETNEILNVENTVDSIEQWNIKNKRKFTANNKSKKKRLMQMSNIEQISKVPLISHTDPLFQYKLVTNQLKYKDRYVVDDEKQLSIVLIDDSGSMSSSNKLLWRNTILHNRLNSVAEGESDLLLYYYEVDIHREYVITKDSATKPEEYFNKLKKHSPRGGGTNIQHSLTQAMEKAEKYLKKHKKISHDLPVNIIIVCDGQDTFYTTKAIETHKKVCKETNMKFIVNGVIIGTKHDQLKKFCEYTKGKFIYR